MEFPQLLTNNQPASHRVMKLRYQLLIYKLRIIYHAGILVGPFFFWFFNLFITFLLLFDTVHLSSLRLIEKKIADRTHPKYILFTMYLNPKTCLIVHAGGVQN